MRQTLAYGLAISGAILALTLSAYANSGAPFNSARCVELTDAITGVNKGMALDVSLARTDWVGFYYTLNVTGSSLSEPQETLFLDNYPDGQNGFYFGLNSKSWPFNFLFFPSRTGQVNAQAISTFASTHETRDLHCEYR